MTYRVRNACGFVAAVALLAAASAWSPPALAQASGMAGIGESTTVSIRATVKSIDLPSRMVTLIGPQGNELTVKVSDEVQNLPQVKPGDTVVVRYHASVAYVLAPRGTKLAGDSLSLTGAKAAPGQLPGGSAGAKLVINAMVVGIDQAANTLMLVPPDGGRVRSVDVITPEGQKAMKLIKVGDTITAVVSEAVAVSVDPAR